MVESSFASYVSVTTRVLGFSPSASCNFLILGCIYWFEVIYIYLSKALYEKPWLRNVWKTSASQVKLPIFMMDSLDFLFSARASPINRIDRLVNSLPSKLMTSSLSFYLKLSATARRPRSPILLNEMSRYLRDWFFLTKPISVSQPISPI